ncbi:head-tail connector protein [uncultured Sphingomonas sp.]|uniref:head-tail connector protein n=1 Tax=uncultured Sphingomonas sp. TaxID=158754 RepID=UPI0025D1D50F|nr:head-tail connector protein [uncultured Sphingomonas sp.]
MSLVTLAEAQDHLREWDDEKAAEIALKSDMATDIVLDYIERAGPADGEPWTDATAPFLIKAAVLLVLRVLYDDDGAEPLSGGVRGILHRYRNPAVA